MKFCIKAILSLVFFSIAIVSYANEDRTVTSVKQHDGSEWSVERDADGYSLLYANINKKFYRNITLIGPGSNENALFLSSNSDGTVTLVIAYPRDTLAYEFSGGAVPVLRSACREMRIASSDEMEVVALMNLCDKNIQKNSYSLPDVKADALLQVENLRLQAPVSALISSDKAFLLDRAGNSKPRKPYLIKGDKVVIENYKHPLVIINYTSRGKLASAWINVVDIL
ncbi:hypothetical protein [Siccibacter colletis]|uniref:hypothetical protein n=1 Tax=Siccibacter colletis TaxID=1505757 RepID=UPI003CF62ACD